MGSICILSMNNKIVKNNNKNNIGKVFFFCYIIFKNIYNMV